MNRDSLRIFDEYLAASAVAGDREALGRLVARWQPRLIRHAWRLLGDADSAGDMVQEARIEILRGLARLDDVAAFPAWAYRIVTRRCQRRFQRSDRERWVPEDAAEEAMERDESFHVPDRESGEFAAELANVMQAISTLPPPQRAALALFYIEDLGVAEIAIALDVPPGTVKTRLMHARRKVRAQLEGEHHEERR
ncbi:MAG: RNA polymerase sigma factor [Pseudomonadota bacterium]|nr:RNA polymerase sigma factor [Pseudomonadota bacterium]